MLFEAATRRAEFEKRLLAIVSHDLRTPLSAITMACLLLSMQQSENDVIVRIERSAARMARVIEDVMGRSSGHVRAPQDERGRGDADLTSFLSELADDLRTAFPGRALLLEVPIGGRVQLDTSRFSQLVSNLVRNAFQHGDSDLPVTVKVERGGELTLSVHNHGPAIEPELMPHLFDPFHRGKSAKSSG